MVKRVIVIVWNIGIFMVPASVFHPDSYRDHRLALGEITSSDSKNGIFSFKVKALKKMQTAH